MEEKSMDQSKRQQRFGGLALYEYDGIKYQSVFFQKHILQKIEQTYFNADDIFIAVYPKCGMYLMIFQSVGEVQSI